MNIDPRLLHPTNLNSQFHNNSITFADYIQQTQGMLKNARIDITPTNQDNILTANSPYNWIPSPHKPKRGILLIHGLYDSPFSMMDLGKHLLSQGFIVRSILLPGHGTVPGDLLNIKRNEWIKVVDYGFASLQQEVEQIFIGGFSLGGTLALHKAIRHPEVRGLILFAPAIKLWRCRLAYLGQSLKLINWLFPNLKWYRRNSQKSYTKYESFCFNAAFQGCKLARETHALLQKKPLKMPLFITQSTTDETVIADGVLDLFKQLPNPQSRLLLYTPQPIVVTDPRIKQRTSYFPEKNILDFSHTCMPFAPDNYYYGAQGVYQDFAHYQHNIPIDKKIYNGSISKKNLSLHTMQRLSYNPDFDNMLEEIDEFLNCILGVF